MSKSAKAKEFLKSNNVEETLGEMVNTLLHSEENNQPIVFMIKYLSGLLTEKDRELHGINVQGPFPQKYVKSKKEGQSTNSPRKHEKEEPKDNKVANSRHEDHPDKKEELNKSLNSEKNSEDDNVAELKN